MSTDSIRRFYVVNRHSYGRLARPHSAVVDRTGFLQEKKIEIGTGLPTEAEGRANEIARGRNECEAAGEHIFVGESEMKCQRCDATARPDIYHEDK